MAEFHDDGLISHRVTVSGQMFNVRIAPEETEFYNRIADFVNNQHAEIRGQGFVSAQQIWAMTSFQIAIQLFEARERDSEAGRAEDRVKRMIARIDEALSAG